MSPIYTQTFRTATSILASHLAHPHATKALIATLRIRTLKACLAILTVTSGALPSQEAIWDLQPQHLRPGFHQQPFKLHQEIFLALIFSCHLCLHLAMAACH